MFWWVAEVLESASKKINCPQHVLNAFARNAFKQVTGKGLFLNPWSSMVNGGQRR